MPPPPTRRRHTRTCNEKILWRAGWIAIRDPGDPGTWLLGMSLFAFLENGCGGDEYESWAGEAHERDGGCAMCDAGEDGSGYMEGRGRQGMIIPKGYKQVMLMVGDIVVMNNFYDMIMSR